MSRTFQAFGSWINAVLILGVLGFMPPADAAHGLPFKLPPSFASFKPLRLDSEEKRWLQERGKLRVGITLDGYEPIDITNDRNRYQGISADYLSIIRDTLGVQVEVLGFRKRDQAVAELLAGKIDVLTSASGFERGIEGIEFSQDYLEDQPVIVGRDFESESIVDWSGKKIGFLDGYIDIQAAHAFYPDSEIIITPTMHSAMEALIEGDIDAFIGNEVIVQAFNSIRPYSRLRIIDDSAIPVSGFAFATRLADRQLTGLIDQVLNSVDQTLSGLIFSRWTQGLEGSIARQHIDLLPAEREWIKANPVVTVVSQQYPLYTFRNAMGEWEGLSIDILARISRMTGLQFVHEESFSTAQTLGLLKSGRGQMNATLSISPERKEFLNFTYSYGGAPWVFIVRTHDSRLGSLEQLSGKVLALPARHALEAMIRRDHPEIEVHTVASFDQARSLVEKGEADATIQSETQAYLYPPGRLKVGRTVEGRWSADTFSVHAKHPELLSILNKALEAMTMTEIRTLRSKWLGGVRKAPLVESTFYHSPWLYAPMAALLVAGLLLFLCNRRLHNQVVLGHAREAQLQEAIAFQRRYLDGIPSPIFVVGVKGELVTCNRSYEERLSIKLERIQGLNSLEANLYPPSLAEQLHRELLGVIRSRKPFYIKRVMEFNACSSEVYQWTVPFYSSTGQLEGLVGGWFDGSEGRKWDVP